MVMDRAELTVTGEDRAVDSELMEAVVTDPGCHVFPFVSVPVIDEDCRAGPDETLPASRVLSCEVTDSVVGRLVVCE